MTALAAEIRQQLDGTYPNLPPGVFAALVRELAWVKWRWESGEHPVVSGERVT